MPYRDRNDRICGFLDIEEKEASGIFVRRFFLLDKRTRILEYYMDNPQNLPDGSKAVGSFNMQFVSMVRDISKPKSKGNYSFALTVMGRNHYLAAGNAQDKAEWIQHLTDACKITVDAEVYDDEQCDSIGSYTTEICGGIVHRIPLEGQVDSDFDSSCDELDKDDSTPHSGRPHNAPTPIKTGYCIKQGALRKNWKRRYFVLDEEGISYYKSKCEKSPIRIIKKNEIMEARISIGIHLTKSHLFEVVTPYRVFYIQAESDIERDSWIAEINKHTKTRKTKSETDSVEGDDKLVLHYHRQMSELPIQDKYKHLHPGYSSTL